MTTETIDLDSTELFNNAMSDEPIQEATPEPVVTEQPRGPDGKFAAREQEAEPEAQPEPVGTGKNGANEPPAWRKLELLEERRQAEAERDAARNEAAQFRQQVEQMQRQLQAPKPEPVDFYADQDAWAQQKLSPIEQRMSQMQLSFNLRASRAENLFLHGKEVVEAAEAAVGEAMNSGDPDIPALRAKLLATDNPVGETIKWYQSRSMLKETGGDLNAYREKALEAALNDPTFLAKAMERARAQANGQTQPSAIQMPGKTPPSINRLASAASPHEEAGDMSDASLFAHATR